jgi:probable HAF family extracellular repeat protein
LLVLPVADSAEGDALRPLHIDRAGDVKEQLPLTTAVDLNNAGQVVGHALTRRGASHPFLHTGGTLVDLGTLPGGRQNAAHAINDSGHVVGASETGADTQAAFVFSSGVLRDLNTLIPASAGWHLAEARDINNSGTIVGVGLRNGQQRAFRLVLAH